MKSATKKNKQYINASNLLILIKVLVFKLGDIYIYTY